MKKNIITIGREYGSGGREIGLRLAERLGWKFYDKELIAAIAEKTMMPENIIANSDEQSIRKNIFQDIFSTDAYDQERFIFEQQGKFIIELAQKGNCIIIGRRADFYLRDFPNAMHIFCYADQGFRAERIAASENCSVEEAKVLIADMDKRRRLSYEYATNRGWGEMHNFDRMICTSSFGIDAAVEEIISLLEK